MRTGARARPPGPLDDPSPASVPADGLTVATRDRDPRRQHDRGPGLAPLAGVGRGGDDDVQRRLELAAERGPHVGERAVLRRRQADRERHGQAEFGQRRREQVGRDRVVPQEAGEQRREQPVLVLGTLRPRGDQVRQLEVPRRQVPADDAAVAVVLVHHAARAAAHVLADVVEVDVDGGRVAPAGPLLGGGVEDDLDVAVRERLGPDQRPQRLVDLLDHLPRSHPRSSERASHRLRDGSRGGGRPEGQRGSPDRAVVRGAGTRRKATFLQPRCMNVAFLDDTRPDLGGAAGAQ